jgi:uncharacterized membrane protein
MTRYGARSRAQATVYLVGTMPLFLAVVGLALDGGHMFAQRTELQAIADAAARAGAVQLDTGRMYREGTGLVVLSPADAEAAARDYAAYHGLPADALDVQAYESTVSVRVWRSVPTVFVRIVRINTLTIRAASTAHARYGIDQPLNGSSL